MTAKFNYQIPISRSIQTVALVLGATLIMAYVAYSNEKGFGLFGIISFTISQASLIYWFLTLLLIFAVFVTLMLLLRSIKGPEVILLNSEYLVAPRAAIRKELLTIPYTEIKQISVSDVKKNEVIVLDSSVGRVALLAIGFPTFQEFEKFGQILAERINHNKVASTSKLQSQVDSDLNRNPKTAALIHAIKERSQEDPLVGAKIGAKEVFQRLIDSMQDEKGVHVESLLCALGALAGYACQASLRAQASQNGLPETAPFHTIKTANNQLYFFGDPLNHAIAGAEYSVWGLAAWAAQHAGASELLDLNELFAHTTSTIGDECFGVPRIPERHRAGDMPINYLKALWLPLFSTVKLLCPEPTGWPIVYGIAIQQAIEDGKDAIDPAIALKIVMESAIPMSKVDLECIR